MIIELLSCFGCSRIFDNLSVPELCPRCHTKFFKAVNPSKWILVCWFFNNPTHVSKLLLKDLWETIREKAVQLSHTDSTGS